MKLTRKTVSGVLYATVIVASTNAPALTLGKVRGAALLGKELDVAVTVQFAADEDASATCFAADVSYGDSPVESSRLTIKAQAGSVPNAQLVRIVSSARVDDAVVTVNLKTTCGPRAARRYVLLSDLVSDLAPNAAVQAVAGGAVTQSAALRKDPPSVNVSETPGTAPTPPVAASGKKVRAAKKPDAAAAKPSVPAAANALGVANVEALSELHQRVEAIEKWQAQSTVADDLLKSQDHSKVLEADIQGLKTITAKNQQNLQSVTQVLEAAESESYGRSLVYALGALLAACLGAVAYVFSRTRGQGADSAPWWFGGGDARAERKSEKPALVSAEGGATDVGDAALLSSAVAQIPAVPAVSLPVPVVPVVDVDVDIDIDGPRVPMPTPAAVAVVEQRAEAVAPVDAPGGAQGASKVINTQEMLDIRQQAEFFMALGQHDDAVKLLGDSIQNSSEANPLVFLDLLKILHTLSRREGFERYREEFNQHFTGRVPAYEDFLTEGNGLDAYEDICQQIVVLWPTEYTVDFIEQCLVRVPEDDPEQGIDLEAFKDLLLLYGILKRLDQASDSAMLPFSTSRTQMGTIQPTENASSPEFSEENAAPLPVLAASAAASSGVDLDLDLDLNVGTQEPSLPAQDNLIDFDMSGFVKPDGGKDAK